MPSPLSAGARHTLAHSYAHSCLSTCSPAGSSRATQDSTQRVFNLPQTTASIKARKATTVLCQRAGWGVGGEQGTADGWMRAGLGRRSGRPVWAFCLIKGGYLYLPGNNGMQTRGARTIKRHFLGGDEEAAREIIMQSVPAGETLFTQRVARPSCLFSCWWCGRAGLRLAFA